MTDSRSFNRIQSPSHCLSHLLPPEKHHLGLRPRGHSHALHVCPNSPRRRSFIPLCLFLFSSITEYCFVLVYPEGQHCSKIMKPPQSLPLQMAECLYPSHKCYDWGLRAPYDVKIAKFARWPCGRRRIARSP